MSVKQKHLNIVKPGGFQHLAPLSARKRLEKQNSLLPANQKYTIETVELTAEEESKWPAKAKTVASASTSSMEAILEKENASLEKQVKDLQAQLEAAKAKTADEEEEEEEEKNADNANKADAGKGKAGAGAAKNVGKNAKK